jgi:TetR/AcrR family transcriptional regulator, mexJK operon transcriptional repressor
VSSTSRGVLLGAPSGASPAPNRRLSPQRTARITEAARILFMRHGFAGTTMDAVAREAGMSKATLYAHFADKQALFADIIADEGEQYAALLLPRADEDMHSALAGIGARLLDLLLSPSTVAAYRIVAAEANRSPELGAIFFRNGPSRLLERVAGFLASAMARGQLRAAEPHIAAAQFIELIRGELGMRAMLGMPVEDRDAVLAGGVDTFLRAYATGAAQPPCLKPLAADPA